MHIIHHSNKKLPIILASLVVVGGVVAGYFIYHHYSMSDTDKSGINYSKPTKDQLDAGQQVKKQVQENASKGTTSKDISNPPSSGIQTQITTAIVQDSTLYIRNDISGIYQDGTCTLSLSQGSQVITETSGIQPLPQSSTCKGFNIPISKLSSGTWSIKLNVVINSQTASATSSVEVQ